MASVSVNIRDFAVEIPGQLSADSLTWEFPEVVSKNAHDKEMFWRVYVRIQRGGVFIPIEKKYFEELPNDLTGWINVDSGIRGGKVKKSVPTVVKSGKNIGKKSATNAFTQALRDALGLYNKQSKKSAGGIGVKKDDNGGDKAGPELYPPMLAQVLRDQTTPPHTDEDHPLYIQRKYNGVRTVSVLNGDNVIMYSRRKNLYPGFGYMKTELLPILREFYKSGRVLYLDGEIYSHGAALQDISGYARREDQPGDIKYNYMIYDCFIPAEPELPYSARKKIIDGLGLDKLQYCKQVETFEVYDTEEAEALYKSFLEEGYEGAMVRVDAPYRYSYNEYHSKMLLKMKPVNDAEMEIVGWETGEKGKAASAIMIICATPEGKQFPVTPAMEIPDRIALAKKMTEIEPNGKTHFENHWKGKKIIIEFDEYSKDKVPQRARTRMQVRTWD